jgi:NodT family efflux transporter outer membrane factor (OMF) lipoprotein
MHRRRAYFPWIVLAGISAGCSLQSAKRLVLELPPSFEQASPSAAAAWPSRDWYGGFGSPELDALIAAVSANSFELSAARARVAQADARARRAHAEILPSLDGGGNGNFLAGHSGDGSARETDWSVLLSASYEVDFWGKNRATADSARYQAVAARGERATLVITTLAGVATGYFEALCLQERIAVARANVLAARRLMDVVDARFAVGASNPVEVAAQRAALAAAELAIPDLERQRDEALASLAVLLGRSPEGFRIEGGALESLREPTVAAGLPSELLRRRPDIFTAEANLESGGADLVAARAALFPSLSLTAAAGLQNPALNAAVTSLSGVGPTLNIGAAITQPIFDAGRLRAVRAEAEARQQELEASYRAAILAALVDVENSLSAIKHLDEAKPFETASVAESERAFDGARLRYQAGQGDFLAVLEAERSVAAAHDQYSQYRLARLMALVSLCKALGGGWQASDVDEQSGRAPPG